MADGTDFIVGRYDGAVKLNNLERSFARALDEAEFVLWWHRNPDKKTYAVRVVRSEHYHPGDAPMQRLLETKAEVPYIRFAKQRLPVLSTPAIALRCKMRPGGCWLTHPRSCGERKSHPRH